MHDSCSEGKGWRRGTTSANCEDKRVGDHCELAMDLAHEPR
jgi:hypothetical protein